MKPSDSDATRRRYGAEPDLSEMLNDLVIQIMMQYDGISESELNDVINKARARLSPEPVAPEAEKRDERQLNGKGDDQPRLRRKGDPSLRNDKRKKRSSQSPASDHQLSEIAAAFKESR